MKESRLLSFGVHERSVSSGAAVNFALQFIDSMELTYDIHYIGKEIKTTICYLKKDKVIVSNGFGKGLGKQSMASALFEAIEHYYTIYNPPVGSLFPKSLNFHDDDQFLKNGCPDFERILSGKDLKLSRFEFKGVLDEGHVIQQPIFLTDPGFQANSLDELSGLNAYSLMRYSTNSGSASGLSLEEAVLHGMLEIIERDSLGVELLKTVIKKNPLPVRIIDINFLKEDVMEIINMIKIETSASEITLYDISTDVCIPSILAAIHIDNGGTRLYFGSGASIVQSYAIERALLEAVQRYHLVVYGNGEWPMLTSKLNTNLPAFMGCLMERGIFSYRGGIMSVLPEKTDALIYKNEKSQLEIIVEKLEILGIKAYYRVVHRENISVVQVCSPKLERFHLVGRGVPVLPGNRGRYFLEPV